MTMAISKAAEEGAKAVICASTGNTTRQRRGLRRPGRHDLRRARARGQDRAGQDGAGARPRRAAAAGRRQLRRLPDPRPRARRRLPGRAGQPVNPVRIEGQKTAAFEIGDALGDAPDVHCLPVGNAGNITAYWMGYQEYAATA